MPMPLTRTIVPAAAACLLLAASGCRTTRGHRRLADRTAERIVTAAQQQALGRTEPLAIESPADTLRRRLLLDQGLPRSGPASLGLHDVPPPRHWPRDDYVKPPPAQLLTEPGPDPLRLSLVDALQAGAAGNRDYQARKEDVYRAALDLDLERNEFRTSFSGLLTALFSSSSPGRDPVNGLVYSGEVGVSQKLLTGASVTTRLAVDLAQLLTQGGASSRGLLADATVTVPLLRGAGRHIVAEPLTQAERNVLYALHTLERARQSLAVQVTSDYLGVLRLLDEVRNAEENYRSLTLATNRARRLADAGRLPEIQVDQARQDQLRARSRWIAARLGYGRRLDSFKSSLGLPVDARVELDPAALEDLSTRYAELLNHPAPPVVPPPATGGAPAAETELADEAAMVALALANRLDLRSGLARVEDAQRRVVVAADGLRAGLTLEGSGAAGSSRSVSSATSEDANIRLDEGAYCVGLSGDLPWERTAERKAYRESLIALEEAVRDLQQLEDDIKAQVRNGLRTRAEARESVAIQAEAVRLAARRVASTDLFLQAGRAEIRDLLEAQESLVTAQNARTASLVSYRVAELELLRDTGVLQVTPNGLWQETAHASAPAPAAP